MQERVASLVSASTTRESDARIDGFGVWGSDPIGGGAPPALATPAHRGLVMDRFGASFQRVSRIPPILPILLPVESLGCP
jgi:hypothetical protein